MDNIKNRVWQIVLLVLLLIAIIAVIAMNGELSHSKATLSNTSALLTAEQEISAALQAELDSALSDNASISNALETAKQSVDQLTADIALQQSASDALTTQLADAETRVSVLEAEVSEKDSQISSLKTAADASAAKITELETAIKNNGSALQTASNDDATTQSDAATDEPSTIAVETPADVSAQVADATAHLQTLTEVITTKQATLNTLTEAIAEAEAEKADAAEATALPESVANLETLNLDEITAKIETITTVDAAAITDEERLTALRDLDQMLTDYAARLDLAVADLSTSEAALAVIQSNLDSADAALEASKADLDTAEISAQALTEELNASLTTIDALQSQISALKAQNEVDASQLSDLESKLAETIAQAESKSAELEKVTAQIDTLTADFAAQKAAYEQRLKAMEAYLLSRSLSDGEAHSASSISNEIIIAKDGVTGSWNYANTSASGNTVVLSISIDNNVIFTSEPLVPGQIIESFTLAAPLSAGSYSAMAVTVIYDTTGTCLFTSSVPVTLTVEG